MRRPVLAAALLVLALAGGVPARAAASARGFTVEAAAFPVEPAPGSNQTELAARPAAARAALSNPPATAYGRAAAYDLGTIELYTGPPPPESVAECDTGSPNIPDQATAAPADMQLAATCRDRPAADVTASAHAYQSSGMAVRGMTSHVAADGGDDAVISEATVSAHDVSMGPLEVAEVSTRASARADGTPGGARATGKVVATGASVNGTPVVIGADGVDVDKQKVPLELVGTATEGVRAALAQGGYSDVRVVQPATEASPDGLRASVRGGGLALYFTNNNPGDNYFLRVTFVGVRLSVDLGPPVGGEGPTVAGPTPAGGGGGVTGGTAALGSSGRSPAAAAGTTTAVGPVAAVARPVLTSGRHTYDRPGPWRGWPVLVALCAGAAAAGWLTRRRLLAWWDVNADRYLRG